MPKAPKINLRAKIKDYKLDLGLLEVLPCTEQENSEYMKMRKNGEPLPQGVREYSNAPNEFYKIHDPELSKEELAEFLTYKQLSLLNTIKKCVVFFTVSAVIGLVFGVFSIVLTL